MSVVATITQGPKFDQQITRATLSEIAGGGFTLMASKDRRDLIVYCGLGLATLPFAKLSRTLAAVQSNPRSDSIRRREEIIGAPRQNLKTHMEIT